MDRWRNQNKVAENHASDEGEHYPGKYQVYILFLSWGKRRGNEHQKLVYEKGHCQYDAASQGHFHSSADHFGELDEVEIGIPCRPCQDIEYSITKYEADYSGDD